MWQFFLVLSCSQACFKCNVMHQRLQNSTGLNKVYFLTYKQFFFGINMNSYVKHAEIFLKYKL